MSNPYHFGMGTLTTFRTKARLSQADLADLVGTSQPQIQRLEKGTRGLSRKWAIRIAKHVKTFPETLMFGDRSVPLVGFVGAGSEAHFYADSDANIGRARMPPGGSEETVAVEVRGDSLGAAFDGWLVYYDERREPPTDDLLGLLCVVGLPSGQVLVKTLMRGRLPGHFDLFPGAGGRPMTDQVVEWAAKVTVVMPPWLAKMEDFAEPQQQAKRKLKSKKGRHKSKRARR